MTAKSVPHQLTESQQNQLNKFTALLETNSLTQSIPIAEIIQPQLGSATDPSFSTDRSSAPKDHPGRWTSPLERGGPLSALPRGWRSVGEQNAIGFAAAVPWRWMGRGVGVGYVRFG